MIGRSMHAEQFALRAAGPRCGRSPRCGPANS